jgi:hypothetical protein
MTIDPQNISGTSAGLVDRVKNMLLTPKAEWERIAAETPDTNKLFVGYALPLLALGAICGLIGATVIGMPFLGRLPIAWALTNAIFSVVVGLVSLFVSAVIANALAPSFGSRQDMGRAQQLVIYGATASMVAAVVTIFPPLGILAILGGLYSIVLMYFGLPYVMNTPADKQVVYLVVLIIAYVVVFWILMWVVGIITLSLGFSAVGAAANMGVNPY